MKKEPILEVHPDGTKLYYVDGILHREDGPAVEYPSGTKYWYRHGLIHREDGPAVEFANGGKIWCYEDQSISSSSQEEFEKIIRLKAFW